MKRISIFFVVLLVIACSKTSLNKDSRKDNLLYEKAFEFRELGKADSAFSYFNQAKDMFLLEKDSLGAGKCLVNMGIISTDKGDYFGGEEFSLNAIKYFNKNKINQHSFLHSNYNNLGIAAFNLKDYSNALKFYDLAISFSHSPLDVNLYLNNKAKVYQEVENFKESIKIYKKILFQASKNKMEHARALSNLARTKWLIDPNYNPEKEFIIALNIRKQENDLWGLNASYSHLADYYADKKPSLAKSYSLNMYNVAKQIASPTDQLLALQKLIKYSPLADTRFFFRTYQKLSDSLQTARNASKNQFALIRYETEKHKADNLILQKENSERKYQIIIISSIALFVLLGGIFWYRKRKRDIETDSQKAITDSKLKTSKKVHDVVANGLYRVMTEIENQQDLDRDLVLDKIEDLYEKSRDISYEKPIEGNKPFHETLSEILTSFATEHRKVLIAGNDAELWLKVREQTKYELEHIIQELMVNMKKHSQASNVVMRFESVGEEIKIYYTDNGIGMPKQKQFNNGLRNTGNRIEEINGAIIFDTEVEKGLKIQISFPIS